MLEAWIDGACEPNPGGTASYGLIVKKNKEPIFSKSEVIGSGIGLSNNVAEYYGLLQLLRWWLPLWANTFGGELIIHSDSQLLVKQMKGEWQAKEGLYLPYYRLCRLLLSNNISFQWIPREQNQEADSLSKQALARAGVKVR